MNAFDFNYQPNFEYKFQIYFKFTLNEKIIYIGIIKLHFQTYLWHIVI